FDREAATRRGRVGVAGRIGGANLEDVGAGGQVVGRGVAVAWARAGSERCGVADRARGAGVDRRLGGLVVDAVDPDLDGRLGAAVELVGEVVGRSAAV